MRRAVFVVDGFNLYHSLREVARQNPETGTRWLNLRALCDSYLHVLGGGAVTTSVHYFSAIAKHLEATKPGLVQRHETYAEALRSAGVVVELSRFRSKDVRCPACGRVFTRYEEKETDVAIGSKIVELALTASCDVIVVVSGDTDIIPAIRTARRLQKAVSLCIAFPHGRASNQLMKAAHQTFKMTRDQYAKHQFPNPVVLASGVPLTKPIGW